VHQHEGKRRALQMVYFVKYHILCLTQGKATMGCVRTYLWLKEPLPLGQNLLA
jgi:hypothetical protein